MENILEKIHKSALRFLVPLTLEETFATVVQEAGKLFGGEDGRILLNEEGGFKLAYASNERAKQPERIRKHGFVYRAFHTRQSFFVPVEEIATIYPEIAKLGMQSAIFVPLSYKNKSIGALVIHSYKSKHFSEDELKTFRLFGSMASLAVKKAQSYDETQKALEVRDLFISMAAHELRTPLTTINGYVQLLQNKLEKKNSLEAKWVEELSWETSRLTMLINELLTVNRIKSGVLDYIWKEHSLREIIKRAVLDFNFNYPERKIIFNDQIVKDSDLIIGDFDKLLQVINNILDNAAKFSPENTEIWMDLKFKSPYLILNIEDKGRGISKENLHKVFEGFYRGKDVSKKGMGLGLFLAKNIIAQHKGSVNIYSQIGKGTMVEIKLRKAER